MIYTIPDGEDTNFAHTSISAALVLVVRMAINEARELADLVSTPRITWDGTLGFW